MTFTLSDRKAFFCRKTQKRGGETVKFILAKICLQHKQKSGEIVKFITQKIRFSKQKTEKGALKQLNLFLQKYVFQNKTNKKRCGEIVKFITQKIRFSKQKTEKGAFSNTNRCDFCKKTTKNFRKGKLQTNVKQVKNASNKNCLRKLPQ